MEVDANKGIVRKLTKEEYEKKKKELESKEEKSFETEKKDKSKQIKMNPLKKGNIHFFKDLTKYDLPTVGGKGANLGELYEFNDVPNGFCISITAYENFLKENKITNIIKNLLKGANLEDSKKLSYVADKIRKLIISKSLSKDLIKEIKEAFKQLNAKKVAVRSSATAEDLPSITEDSPVFVKINGMPKFDLIKNIYAISKLPGVKIEVASMENNGVSWKKAESMYQHPAREKKLYKILTETGREIIITKNHSLIILDEDILAPKTVSITDLNGEELIPVTRQVPLINLKKTKIDVLEWVKGDDVHIENNKIYIKNNALNWKIQQPLPRWLSLNKDLAYFLGLYCAEGSTYKKNGIIITNKDDKILARASEFLKNIGIHKNQKINRNSLRVYCKTLVRFLHTVTGKPLDIKGKGRSSKIKKVPDFIFGCDKELIGHFLAGCFDGDGYLNKNSITYTSTSKMLIGGIIKLLEILPVNFYLREKRKSHSFDIAIPYSEAQIFGKYVFLSSIKKQKILKTLMNAATMQQSYTTKNVFFLTSKLAKKLKDEFNEQLEKKEVNLYYCPLCNNQISKSSYYKNQLRFYCKLCNRSFYADVVIEKKVKRFVNYDEKGRFTENSIPWNKGQFSGRMSQKRFEKIMKKQNSKYADFFNGSIMWDRIKEIEEHNYTGMVYDFTVPKVENFAAGVGGIITHNTASFAGQQDTYLNISGEDEVINAVKKCWASLFTDRAIYYREKNKFKHEDVLISVIIQEMVEAKFAGVMFTKDPIEKKDIMIEIVKGLGEKLVSGEITPNSYLIEKKSYEILNKKEKFNFNENLLKQIAKQGKHIETHYGAPQDIEFAIDKNNKLWILQSRAITTL